MPSRKDPCPCGSGKRYKSCCYARDRRRDAEEEIPRWLGELGADPDYASGAKRHPRRTSGAETAEVLRQLYEQHNKGTRSLLALADREGRNIACRAGCCACCNELILVTLPEAHAIADLLSAPEAELTRHGFLERYPRWRQAAADTAERLPFLAASKDPEYKPTHVAHARKRLPCPLLGKDGLCQVYLARPWVCRRIYILDTADNCAPGDEGPGREATSFSSKELDEFTTRVQALTMAMHHSLGAPPLHRPALPDVLYEILALGRSHLERG